MQLTHDIFIAEYFMLLSDLIPDRADTEGHISLPDEGNIRLELKFDKPLTLYTQSQHSNFFTPSDHSARRRRRSS